MIQLMGYYGEVLTQSARNYAFTQDKKWEKRYRTIEPESNKIIKESISVSTPENRKFFEILDTANQALVKMEYRAIDLVNNGNTKKAVKILESDEYEKQKKILAEGLTYYVLSHDTIKNVDDIILTPSFQMILELEKKLAISEAAFKNEKMATIGELVSRISHDLRGPLSVIKNTLDIIRLKNPDLDDRMISDLSKIERAVTKMIYQIDDVLEYARPKNLELKNSSILDVLHSSLDRTIIPNTVKINLPENDITITCDAMKLEIVFYNLITNAVHAVAYNGQIDVRIMDKKNEAIIEVQDNGPGIPDSILPHLFDPLFTTKPDGTGLGLPSCKNIIEKHGGTISVKSQVGKGATFVIKLPKHTTS